MFNQQGELIACEGANTGGNRRISITTGIDGGKDGTVKTLAERYDGKRFNSPNDLAIDAQGNVYFTDPRYVGDEPRELDFEAVFLVVAGWQREGRHARGLRSPTAFSFRRTARRSMFPTTTRRATGTWWRSL